MQRILLLSILAILLSACAAPITSTPIQTSEVNITPTTTLMPPSKTPTLTPLPVVTEDPYVWQLVGENGEIAVKGIDLTLWPGTDGEQRFAVNPEYAGQLRAAILKHIYAVNWAADETFKAQYKTYEKWQEVIDAEPEELWDIYLDEPHPTAYSTGAWGMVQPVKVRQPVSLKSVSLELVAPEKAKPMVDKKGGYSRLHGYFDYQLEVIIGPGNVPMVQLNFTNDLSADRTEFAQTAIKPGASVEANARMWVMGLNIFEKVAKWMADGFGRDTTRVVMNEGVLSIDAKGTANSLDDNDYNNWAKGEAFVVSR